MDRETWSDTEGVSPERASPRQEQVDRQMIRHLLGKYSREELGRLLQEEGRCSISSPSLDDGSFASSASNFSSRSSQDGSSNMFDSTGSANTFSDTSSACGSTVSNISPRVSSLNGRRRNASPSVRASMALTDDSNWDADDAIPPTAPVKQKGSFTCGFCLEEGIQKTCTRKNDLKRHMEDFHHTNAQWFCRHRGCHMVFDWQTAYKAHLKNSHGGSRMNLDDAKTALCSQTVFACGFETCTQVFEASSDAEASPVFKEYVSHVVKHFDEGASSGQWSYSARIRNLLRQSSVIHTWSQSAWPESEQVHLQWNTQSSNILRKRLETRHLGDVQFLVQYAIALGSNSSEPVQNFRSDFVTPVRSECQMTIHGHNNASAPSSTTPTPDPDHIHYDMSTSHPAMLAYYPRQAYMPQQPPQHSPPYNFHNARHSPGFEAHRQALQQQQYMSVPDTQMGGSDYFTQNTQNVPGPYGNSGMHSPAATNICGSSSPGPNTEQRSAYGYTSSPYAY